MLRTSEWPWGGLPCYPLVRRCIHAGATMPRLLLIDDQLSTLALVRECLKTRFEVVSVTRCTRAYVTIRQASADLVVLEARIPDGSGLDLLATIQQLLPNT